ncbi:hypothetical protein [Burkholderia sp. BE12]|uniref:hypothetical protein n=1 Tax=Burkholderia sp. BE12 TaxID=2082394 RepID=UPI001319B931|nr:hypothetical protein [Burkholderia sp. BE12]
MPSTTTGRSNRRSRCAAARACGGQGDDGRRLDLDGAPNGSLYLVPGRWHDAHTNNVVGTVDLPLLHPYTLTEVHPSGYRMMIHIGYDPLYTELGHTMPRIGEALRRASSPVSHRC